MLIPVLWYLSKVQSTGYAFKYFITEPHTSAGKPKCYHIDMQMLPGNEDQVRIFYKYKKYKGKL